MPEVIKEAQTDEVPVGAFVVYKDKAIAVDIISLSA